MLVNVRLVCIVAVDIGGCKGVKIYSRDSLGARHPTHFLTFHTPACLFFVHHTAWNECHNFDSCARTLRDIQNDHMDPPKSNKNDLNLKEREGVLRLKGIMKCHRNLKFVSDWSDIGYSFLVGQDGNIYEGRGWHHVGAHTKNYNRDWFAASFMGSFTTHLPNNASLNAVKDLIDCGIQKGFISHSYVLFGHRDKGNTTCPGDRLYHEIQSWPHYNHTHP